MIGLPGYEPKEYLNELLLFFMFNVFGGILTGSFNFLFSWDYEYV